MGNGLCSKGCLVSPAQPLPCPAQPLTLAHLLNVHQLRLVDLSDGDVVLSGNGETALGTGTGPPSLWGSLPPGDWLEELRVPDQDTGALEARQKVPKGPLATHYHSWGTLSDPPDQTLGSAIQCGPQDPDSPITATGVQRQLDPASGATCHGCLPPPVSLTMSV